MPKIKNKFLTAIIEASPNAIYLKDEKGRYIMINEQGAASVGLTVADFIGKTDIEIFPYKLGKRTMKIDKKVFQGKPHSGEEPVNEEQIFYSHKFIVEDKETGERALAGISTDISEIKRAERDLADAIKHAEEANRHKTVFLQNMSHELRTPLNAIIGFSSILSGESGTGKDNFEENFREYAKLINSSGIHLLAIINDLLDLSKIEAGEQEFSEGEIDVKYEVESCIQILRSLADNSNITIEEDFTEKDMTLKGDEKVFRQLIYNLLSNAIKYSYAKSTVIVRVKIGNDGGFDISIIDEGIGMSKDDLLTAMTPFRRASQVRDSEISGTGLGLPLVDALIKLFQGILNIQSERGKGTTATLHFPSERSIQA